MLLCISFVMLVVNTVNYCNCFCPFFSLERLYNHILKSVSHTPFTLFSYTKYQGKFPIVFFGCLIHKAQYRLRIVVT